MNIGTICSRQLVTIDAKQSLQQAALLMREHHVGALVVIDNGGDGGQPRVAGVITDRDLAIEVLARGGDAAQTAAGRLVHARVVSVPETAGLAEAVNAMQTHGLRRVLVHDAQGMLVGLVSFDDLLPACVAPLAGLAESMRKGLERETAERGSIAAPSRPALRVPPMGTAGWTVGG
jgi:CBS domain-containing protein